MTEPPDRQRTDAENEQHIRDTLDVLELNLNAFYGGMPAAGMVVAGQLFKLLCDTSRGSLPLALRVFPSLCLAPVYGLPDWPDDFPVDGLVSALMVPMEFGNPDPRAGVTAVARQMAPIPVEDWLAQLIGVFPVGQDTVEPTVGDLISMLRHQDGGGHYDQGVGRVVQAVEDFRFVKSGVDYQLGYRFLADIADYLIGHLRGLLGEDDEAESPAEADAAIAQLVGALSGRPMIHELSSGVFLQAPLYLPDGTLVCPLAPMGFAAQAAYAAQYVVQVLGGRVDPRPFESLVEGTSGETPVVVIAVSLPADGEVETLDKQAGPTLDALRNAVAYATLSDPQPFARIVSLDQHHIQLVPPETMRLRRLGPGNVGAYFDSQVARVAEAAVADEDFAFALSLFNQGLRETNRLFRIAHFFCCLESLASRLKGDGVGSREAVRRLIGISGSSTMEVASDEGKHRFDPIEFAGRIRDKLYHGVQPGEDDVSSAHRDAYLAMTIDPQHLSDSMRGYCELELGRWAHGISRGLQKTETASEVNPSS